VLVVSYVGLVGAFMLVSLGAFMLVSLGAFMLVSFFTAPVLAVVSYPLFTAVVSLFSGAAPVSSERLWQAAKVAAAARIQRVFMISPSGDRCPARPGRRRRLSSAAGLRSQA
jgi:hypothetical protein